MHSLAICLLLVWMNAAISSTRPLRLCRLLSNELIVILVQFGQSLPYSAMAAASNSSRFTELSPKVKVRPVIVLNWLATKAASSEDSSSMMVSSWNAKTKLSNYCFLSSLAKDFMPELVSLSAWRVFPWILKSSGWQLI